MRYAGDRDRPAAGAIFVAHVLAGYWKRGDVEQRDRSTSRISLSTSERIRALIVKRGYPKIRVPARVSSLPFRTAPKMLLPGSNWLSFSVSIEKPLYSDRPVLWGSFVSEDHAGGDPMAAANLRRADAGILRLLHDCSLLLVAEASPI
jgi:hypothetical protein